MLEGNFHINSVLTALGVKYLGIKRRSRPVYVLDKLPYSALVMEAVFPFDLLLYVVGIPLGVLTHIRKIYLKSLCEEGCLPQMICQRLTGEYRCLENLVIRLEPDKRTMLIRLADLRQRSYNVPSFISLPVELSVHGHLNLQPFAEGVYDRGSYSVQTSGNLISVSSEFSSGMKYRKYDLHRRYSFLMMYTDRYSSSVVPYGYRIVRMDNNVYLRAESAQSLVNGVVNDLVDKVVQTLGRRGADIHTRPFPDRLKSLQDLY